MTVDKYTLEKAPNDHIQATILDMAIAKNQLVRDHNEQRQKNGGLNEGDF